jgi:hypothetical protein
MSDLRIVRRGVQKVSSVWGGGVGAGGNFGRVLTLKKPLFSTNNLGIVPYAFFICKIVQDR